MTTAIQPKQVVRTLRDYGPMTADEIRFAFSWPSNIFTAEALKLTEELTGDIVEFQGFYAASGDVTRENRCRCGKVFDTYGQLISHVDQRKDHPSEYIRQSHKER
jgi:hypothetical protein